MKHHISLSYLGRLNVFCFQGFKNIILSTKYKGSYDTKKGNSSFKIGRREEITVQQNDRLKDPNITNCIRLHKCALKKCKDDQDKKRKQHLQICLPINLFIGWKPLRARLHLRTHTSSSPLNKS